MAVIPTYANTCAVLGNDSLAVATQSAMVHAALLILLKGATWRRCLLVALYASAAALTRVSGAMVIPVALLAVLAGAWWHLGGSRRRRAGLGVLISGVLLVSVVLSSGWFYSRNLSDSGDPTGQSAILEQVRYQPVRPPLEVLADASKWLEIHDELWGRLSGMVNIEGALREFARLLTDASMLGAAFALWRARCWRWFHQWRTPRFFSWVIAAGVFASVFLPVFVYHARGGGLHPRYVFGALYLCTLALALGFTGFRQCTAPIVGYTATFVLCLSIHWTYAALRVRRVTTFPLEQALASSVEHAMGAAVCLLVGVTLGFVGVTYALARLHQPLDEPPRTDESGC
jgi:hypothetical protein